MSVHARKRARGKIRDLRDRGRHEAIDAGSESLAEATERWWADHVESSVSQSTAMVYASALDGHLLPRLGSVPIRDLQPADVVALSASSSPPAWSRAACMWRPTRSGSARRG